MAKKTTTAQIDKRSLAKSLYLEGNYTQEEIAEKVGVSRQTVVRWAKDDAWQELKTSMSITPEQLIQQMQQQVAEVNRNIMSRPEGSRYATPAEADAINKLTTAIKKLQEDVGISDIVSVCMRMLTWLRAVDVELAKTFSNLMDAFIKDQINTKR